MKSVLSQQCGEEEGLSASEVFVTEALRVPASWVYEAKGLQAQGYQDLQALHLLHACLWNEAHTVTIDHLLPDAIISGE